MHRGDDETGFEKSAPRKAASKKEAEDDQEETLRVRTQVKGEEGDRVGIEALRGDKVERTRIRAWGRATGEGASPMTRIVTGNVVI